MNNFRSGLAALLWLVSALSLAEEPITSKSESATVYEGYEAFYQSRPDSLFNVADQKPLANGKSSSGRYLLNWMGKIDPRGKLRKIELDGADILVDGRRFLASRAKVFAGEFAATALGSRANLYATPDYICIEGVPSSSNGTAQRHVQVSLIEHPFSRKGATRYELPSLFNSCLGIYHGSQGQIRFFQATFEWLEGQDEPKGVIFTEHLLDNGQFRATGTVLKSSYTEPGNVYRFTVPIAIRSTELKAEEPKQ
jgi:hypothetical protein